MLSSLTIKNFALLRDVSVEFAGGLNILTGETGAGKSIIIGAINIAAGERGYIENIRTGEEKSIIEAVFDISAEPALGAALKNVLENSGIEYDENKLIIKREINRSGKGRIFINNGAAALNTLQQAGRLLVDIHGQHEHQSLLKSEIHMELLDGYARAQDLLARVKEMHAHLSKLDYEIKSLKADEAEKNEKLDMINYRLSEMEQAAFKGPGELAELYSCRERLVHAETIKEHAASAITALSPGAADIEGRGAIDLLYAAKKSADSVMKYDSKPQEAAKMLEEAIIRAEEAKEIFLDYISTLESDPATLKETEGRIGLIEDLIKKYRKKDLAEVMEYFSALSEEKKTIELRGEIISVKEAERQKAAEKAALLCLELSGVRTKKAKELADKIEEELKCLGILKASFEIKLERKEALEGSLSIECEGKKHLFTPQGIDGAEFMISLNQGEELKPLVKIASGGEVSRIMLAIKNILSEEDLTGVLVFDEIDTGISGKIAQAVGAKLLEISGKKQLICITHLPQIAACAQTHFSVEKAVTGGKTETVIIKKTGADRETEVARLLSGEKVSEASLVAARELINTVKRGQ